MLSFLFGFFFHPWFWIAAAVVVAAAVGLWFWKGPAGLLKVAINPHLWLAVAVGLGVLSIMHMENENKALKEQVSQLQTQGTADEDAQKTTDMRVKQKSSRQTQDARLQESINNAPPGQAQDALLDQIAAERPDLNKPSADADGVRKQPDGITQP